MVIRHKAPAAHANMTGLLIVEAAREGSLGAKERDSAMKVLIADGHQGMREVLNSSLNGCGVEVVAVAADSLVAVEKARTLAPDIAILDFQMMPRGSALEAARLIRSEMPAIKIILLTTWDEEIYRREAASCGAIACFPKYVATRDLISAMEAGQRSHPMSQFWASAYQGGAAQRPPTLSRLGLP